MKEAIIFLVGAFCGGLFVATVASALWSIRERKYVAEVEVLEAENGILRQQVNSKPADEARLHAFAKGLAPLVRATAATDEEGRK